MSFFAIQVKSGQEIDAKEMLKSVFTKVKESQVNGIYALETVTQIVDKDSKTGELSGYLNEDDVKNHLQIKRIRENLSNLRAAYAGIDQEDGSAETNQMRESYREEIALQSKKLKNIGGRSKKIQGVLKGYILLELKEDLFELPKKVWHLIKSIPKVTGIVSPYSLPDEEIEQFFEHISLAPTIEVYSSEEVKQDENDCDRLHEENIEVADQKMDKDDKREASIAEQLEELKELADGDSPIQSMFEKCHSFIRRKREVLSMPIPLLRQVYKRHNVEFEKEIRDTEFIQKFMCMLRLEVSS